LGSPPLGKAAQSILEELIACPEAITAGILSAVIERFSLRYPRVEDANRKLRAELAGRSTASTRIDPVRQSHGFKVSEERDGLGGPAARRGNVSRVDQNSILLTDLTSFRQSRPWGSAAMLDRRRSGQVDGASN